VIIVKFYYHFVEGAVLSGNIVEALQTVLETLNSIPIGKHVTGSQLVEFTGLSPEVISVCIGELKSRGLAESNRSFDSGEFDFSIAWITPKGRFEFLSSQSAKEKDAEKKEIETPEDISRNVFVVHGRNEKITKAMEEFIRALDLRPIEWSEARKYTGKANPFTHEIVTAAFNQAKAIIVLLSPEDIAQLRSEYIKDEDSDDERLPTSQPRQNVIFELGMAMGRDEQRTILVQFGTLRKFSDIEGRHTVKMDNSSEKRHELMQRLVDAGCTPNVSGTNWLQAGNFSIPAIDDIQYYPSSALNITPDADETSILLEIARRNNNDIASVSKRIASYIKMEGTKCRYHLDRLKASGYLKTIEYAGGEFPGDWHFLTEKGRQFLVENKHIGN
jgi:predicted nucleotide-binding protein